MIKVHRRHEAVQNQNIHTVFTFTLRRGSGQDLQACFSDFFQSSPSLCFILKVSLAGAELYLKSVYRGAAVKLKLIFIPMAVSIKNSVPYLCASSCTHSPCVAMMKFMFYISNNKQIRNERCDFFSQRF